MFPVVIVAKILMCSTITVCTKVVSVLFLHFAVKFDVHACSGHRMLCTAEAARDS